MLDKALVGDIRRSCVAGLGRREELGRRAEEVLREYKLPDGNIVPRGDQLYQAPEALFSPEQLGVRTRACPRWSPAASPNVTLTSRRPSYGEIVLSGGTPRSSRGWMTATRELEKLAPGDPHQDHGTTRLVLHMDWCLVTS